MDVSNILNELNDRQRDAVTSEAPSLLVLAGAGSGKTRVLVHRVAWIVEAMQSNPNSVMAVTFTNKAANEMKSRIQELLQSPLADLWCGTFHGLFHRMLKMHWEEAGLIKSFSILDGDDQNRIIKRVIKKMNLDEATWQARQTQWFINKQKDEGRRVAKLPNKATYVEEKMADIYLEYQKK